LPIALDLQSFGFWTRCHRFSKRLGLLLHLSPF
jgi:hypothetical protein